MELRELLALESFKAQEDSFSRLSDDDKALYLNMAKHTLAGIAAHGYDIVQAGAYRLKADHSRKELERATDLAAERDKTLRNLARHIKDDAVLRVGLLDAIKALEAERDQFRARLDQTVKERDAVKAELAKAQTALTNMDETVTNQFRDLSERLSLIVASARGPADGPCYGEIAYFAEKLGTAAQQANDENASIGSQEEFGTPSSELAPILSTA
jgi:hypothetical protein